MSANNPLRGRRLLVVEDEYFIAIDLVTRLEHEGVCVIGPVATVDEALALLRSQAIDGAVLDLNLRGEMSFPVADALRESRIPFVLATGYDRASIPDRYDDVTRCEKPVETATIAKALFGWAAVATDVG